MLLDKADTVELAHSSIETLMQRATRNIATQLTFLHFKHFLNRDFVCQQILKLNFTRRCPIVSSLFIVMTSPEQLSDMKNYSMPE